MKRLPARLVPDPHPHTPNYRPPPRACDAHCHLIAPAAEYPRAAGLSYQPPEAPLPRFKALQAILGLERAVMVTAGCYGCDNSVTTAALAQGGGKYRGVANVDNGFTDRDFETLHAAGIRGARFSFARQLASSPSRRLLERVAERIKPLGWHLDLHLYAEDLPELAPMFTDLAVPFVIDHMGRISTEPGLEQAPFLQLLQLLRADERCWVKISGAERISSAGPPFIDALPFAQALIATAADRVLWGTDWPHLNIARHMPNDGDLIDLIPLMTPDPATQRLILVDNPQRLYQFSA